MADTLTLYDVSGKQVLAAVIPDNQQIRFTLEDHTVINRVRVELVQTSAPEGDLGLVASVWLTRQGQPGLDTIDSNRRSEVYWHLTSLRFRNSECKGTLWARYGLPLWPCSRQSRVALQSAGPPPLPCGVRMRS